MTLLSTNKKEVGMIILNARDGWGLTTTWFLSLLSTSLMHRIGLRETHHVTRINRHHVECLTCVFVLWDVFPQLTFSKVLELWERHKVSHTKLSCWIWLVAWMEEQVFRKVVAELISLDMVIMMEILERWMSYRATKSRCSCILFYFQLIELQG
jgi:hypothetical protein